MIKRSTWITLAIFVLLLVTSFIIEIRGKADEGDGPTAADQSEKAIPEEVFTGIHSISIRSENQTSGLVLEKVDEEWSLREDNNELNQARVFELLANLQSLEVKAKPENPSENESFGISSSSAEVILTNTSEKTIQIKIGSQTPTGSGYYIQINNDQPLIVGKGGLETILGLLKYEELVLD